MEFYILVKEIKRVTISDGGGKGTGKDTTAVAGGNPAGSVSSGRRISLRTLLPVVLVLGILLPFVFVRVAILLPVVLNLVTVSLENLKEGDEDLLIFFLDFFLIKSYLKK
jgi:hypothetical protein